MSLRAQTFIGRQLKKIVKDPKSSPKERIRAIELYGELIGQFPSQMHAKLAHKQIPAGMDVEKKESLLNYLEGVQ